MLFLLNNDICNTEVIQTSLNHTILMARKGLRAMSVMAGTLKHYEQRLLVLLCQMW